MSYKNTQVPEGKDPILWDIARRRAGFKKSLATYIIVNAFLWAIWYFTDRTYQNNIPWPVWPTLGWGIGITIQYINAYAIRSGDAVETEYEKLKNKNL
ncbi:MAG: 2TM domain-containing protein [Ferruginibacter sp.]